MPKYCQSCGKPSPSEANFCGECGHKFPAAALSSTQTGNSDALQLSGAAWQNLAAQGERRQVTVLRSDLSGYSGLFQALDPEIVQEILEPIKALATEVIGARGGLVTQFRGDEIIALFGAVMSENDARDAVQAALDLHERVTQFGRRTALKLGKELAMHTGLSTGLVVIQPAQSRDGLFAISGDAINTAARLAAIAGPNEVLIGPSTRRWIEPFFSLEQLPPVLVKGKAEPITPYRVVSAYSERSLFEGRVLRGLSGFVGRTLEFAHLGQALGRARAGNGQIVAISAQAGVGKSRLLYEFLRSIPRQEITVVSGRCAPAGVDMPYAPWIEIIGQLFNFQPGASAQERIDKVLAGCSELELDLQRHMPALCHLLAAPHPDYPMPVIARGPAREHLLWQTLSALIRRSANRRPLILALEDWHWADQASNQFLRHHLGHVASLPVLVIVTFRATSQVSWPVLEHLTTLSLGPLDRDAVAGLVGSMFGLGAAPQWFAAMLHERTGGNALFIEEIVRSLKENNLIRVENGELIVTQPLPAMGIPDTVQSAVLRRLDRLDPAWRETIRKAAVIGPEFSLSILARLMGSDVDLHAIISELEELGFVMQIRDEPQSVFAFKHVIIQSVAYETLLLKQRRELHGEVARAIEELAEGRFEEFCEHLAYHYARDSDWERAVRYLEQAGDRAAQSFAMESARNHFAAAIHLLSEGEQSPTHIRHRIALSLKCAAASQFATSEEHIEVMRRALADATALGDARLLANCHYWLGRMHYGRGDPKSAVPEFEKVLANAASLNDDQLLGRAYCVLGRICLFTAEPARGTAHLERGIAMLRELGDLGEMIYSMSSQACIHAFTGKFARAEELFAEALLLARHYRDRTNEALIQQQLSDARCRRGDWEGATEAAENCLAIAKRGGLPVLAAFAQIFRGYARWMLGDHEAGYKDMLVAIQDYEATGYRLAASVCHGWCAEICAMQGDVSRAKIHAEHSIAKDQSGDRLGQLAAYRALARTAYAQGERGEAIYLLAKAIELGTMRTALPDLGITHLVAAEIEEARGEIETAKQHRTAARNLFRSADMPFWLARAEQETHSSTLIQAHSM